MNVMITDFVFREREELRQRLEVTEEKCKKMDYELKKAHQNYALLYEKYEKQTKSWKMQKDY